MIAIELPLVKRMLMKGEYTISTWKGITKKILKEYGRYLNAGGTMCVEEVSFPLSNGKKLVYPVRKFVPWLDDMEHEDAREVIAIIQKGERTAMHPKQIARELKVKFEGTYHNAMSAARTDARVQAFVEQGVKYVTSGRLSGHGGRCTDPAY